MPAIYALSDIVTCISTKPESFGLISIEAQAMGRMVIVSNLGGIRETIIDKETGWIIEPGNIEELVKIISKIINMSVTDRIKIANLARKHIESKFSLEKMNKSIIRIYNSIL
jgi:glycosyltransferase involved in cell wall biosynthesis